MKTLLLSFVCVVGFAGSVQAASCDVNLGAAKEIIRLAEVEINFAKVQAACENGGKANVIEATQFCDYTAYKENINIDKALALCYQMENDPGERLR